MTLKKKNTRCGHAGCFIDLSKVTMDSLIIMLGKQFVKAATTNGGGHAVFFTA